MKNDLLNLEYLGYVGEGRVRGEYDVKSKHDRKISTYD